MTKLFLTWTFFAISAATIIAMALSLWQSLGLGAKKNRQMFLPHDFFQTLLLLVGMWVIIFTIMASANLASVEKQVIVMISSLLAPFLIWWWRKKMEEEN